MSDLREMAITRALEVLERDSLNNTFDYRTHADANWLGYGVGFCHAMGWAESFGGGLFFLTAKGRNELHRRLMHSAPRLQENLVPSMLDKAQLDVITR